MPRLTLNESGLLVKRWNQFLEQNGMAHAPGDMFTDETKRGTMQFQSAINQGSKTTKLTVDGVAGNMTLGYAISSSPTDSFDAAEAALLWGYEYPKMKAGLPSSIGQQEMHKKFGEIEFERASEPGNEERIIITNDWKKNLQEFQVPQLSRITGGISSGKVWFHHLVGHQLVALWNAWEQVGLLADVKSYEGAFNARLKRGSKTELSNHAWATAFDINYSANKLSALPSTPDENGTVYRLVPLANVFGFTWGGFFKSRLDGMHFEVTEIMSAEEVLEATNAVSV